MTPEELPAIRTPVTAIEIAMAFCSAYRAITWQTASRETILVLLAHSALETGRWKSMWCYNIGNVKSRPGDGRCWTFFRCNEIEHGEVVWYDPPNPACRFRAFHTLTEGSIDHIGFLAKSTRYAKAWADVVAGRPAQFVRELKAAGYFTAELGPYEHAVVSIFKQFLRELVFQVPTEEPPIDAETRERVLALVSRTSNEATERWRAGSPLPSDDDEEPPTEPNT